MIFQNTNSHKLSLVNKKEGVLANITYSDFPYLGIWATPNAPFVCIEPWLGIGDVCDSSQNLEEKEGIISLNEKQIFQANYTIEIPMK